MSVNGGKADEIVGYADIGDRMSGVGVTTRYYRTSSRSSLCGLVAPSRASLTLVGRSSADPRMASRAPVYGTMKSVLTIFKKIWASLDL